jgi:hypothetical protein
MPFRRPIAQVCESAIVFSEWTTRNDCAVVVLPSDPVDSSFLKIAPPRESPLQLAKAHGLSPTLHSTRHLRGPCARE